MVPMAHRNSGYHPKRPVAIALYQLCLHRSFARFDLLKHHDRHANTAFEQRVFRRSAKDTLNHSPQEAQLMKFVHQCRKAFECVAGLATHSPGAPSYLHPNAIGIPTRLFLK
jgi:hypothetical protein